MSRRRKIRKAVLADITKKAYITRPDTSRFYLNDFKNQGYEQARFVANPAADPECTVLDGYIYEIDALLRLDNPLYRISHPNCLCEFEPYRAESTAVGQPAEGVPGLPAV